MLYAEGMYEGPMFSQPIQAQCVLVLRAGYVQETNGRYYITNRLDAFIHIDHVGLDLVAKTFSPLVTKTVDINFRETAAFVSVVSRTAASNPQGMQRLAGKLTALDPKVRGEFVRLSAAVGDKAQVREAVGRQADPVPNGPRPLGKTAAAVRPAGSDSADGSAPLLAATASIFGSACLPGADRFWPPLEPLRDSPLRASSSAGRQLRSAGPRFPFQPARHLIY